MHLIHTTKTLALAPLATLDEVVANGGNFAQTDANTIRQLAARGFLTNPGGGKLGSANFVVNCPVLGFADMAPTEDQAPRPASQP